MTPETRRNVLRYGIAIDLAIVATGVGLLVPASANALIVAYVAAAGLASWKGGWQGGMTSILLSVLLQVYFFLGEPLSASHILGFVLAGAATMAIVRAAMAQRVRYATPLPGVEPTMENVVSFDRVLLDETGGVSSRERQQLARALEHTAAQQLEAQRREAKRRAEEDAELRKREAREAKERAAAEKRRLEQEKRAAKKAERDRAAAEKKGGKAAEQRRIEEERRAAEEAAAQAKIEEARREAEEAARVRAEEERRAAEAEAERRIEEERRAAEAAAQAKIEEARREAEEAARVRAEEERRAAEAEAERRIEEERRVAEATMQAKIEEARRAAEAEAERRIEEERRAAEEAARVRAEAERRAAEEAALRRIEDERRAAEEAARARAEGELQAAREAAERRIEEERRALEESARTRIEEERRIAQEELQRRLEAERETLRAHMEEQLAAERQTLEKQAGEQLAAQRKSAEDTATKRVAPEPPKPAKPSRVASVAKIIPSIVGTIPSVVGTVGSWFRRAPKASLSVKKAAVKPVPRRPAPSPSTASSPSPAPPRRPSPVGNAPARKPRLLLLERRRGTADTVVPKLKNKGVEVEVVERWVDAVDELFRFRPDAILIDSELPEFEKIYRTIVEQNAKLPIVLTGRSDAGFMVPAHIRYAAFTGRPYDAEDLARLAAQAMAKPLEMLAIQTGPRSTKPAPKPKAVVAAATNVLPAAAAKPVALRPPTNDQYEVGCFNCRIGFNALDADWCSCLTKERTLVCTNCLTCFCKAPPAYKEKFWVEAPPKLFERKSAEARRQQNGLPGNPAPSDVKHPLVLTVEDDEEIQAIVQRVCSNLGYGFVYATNGQDGLAAAHDYHPDLILSDAFMPKLDGREMCRLLKEEPAFRDTKMVVMTGLYTDTKYRSEALKRFRVDDYVAKPVAITELISLLQKHLEGVTGAPVQDVDLHELHRKDVDAHAAADGIPLQDLLDAASAANIDEEEEHGLVLVQPPPKPAPRPDEYEVCCFNCQNTFDAVHAEWCSCVGRDQTLVCTHCHGCFCKSPAAYKERFWMDAPPSLFERKMIGSKRNLAAKTNPQADELKRPLILLVEDDENVQLIVRTVVTSMGFGFIVGANGQEGLSLAREYGPDLILSDAFMPKLDGREMCRLLKEDPTTAATKAIIMTGLYTDRKYRNEALDYFKVDDYVAKPLAVDDLIKLFKKHLPQEVQATM